MSDDYKNKFEAAKELVQQLDRKVAKYESTDMDIVLETLDEYEKIGTIEEIKSKLESAKTEPKKDKKEEDDVSEEAKTEVEDLKKQLAAYQEIGTIEELEELMERYKESKDTEAEVKNENKKLNKKVESMNQDHEIMLDKLESYAAIGSIGELNDLIDDYAIMKHESEARRISQELNISYDKAASTIEKMESVSEAEELLRELFKGESASNTSRGMRDKTESAEVIGSRFGNSDKNQRLRELMERM